MNEFRGAIGIDCQQFGAEIHVLIYPIGAAEFALHVAVDAVEVLRPSAGRVLANALTVLVVDIARTVVYGEDATLCIVGVMMNPIVENIPSRIVLIAG